MVKKENIPVVFTIEFSDGKIADAICADSGAEKLLFHSCHNVTKSQFDEGVTYISLMYENINSLREAICS
jgi:zinc transport system substrate-binding protein